MVYGLNLHALCPQAAYITIPDAMGLVLLIQWETNTKLLLLVIMHLNWNRPIR